NNPLRTDDYAARAPRIPGAVPSRSPTIQEVSRGTFRIRDGARSLRAGLLHEICRCDGWELQRTSHRGYGGYRIQAARRCGRRSRPEPALREILRYVSGEE